MIVSTKSIKRGDPRTTLENPFSECDICPFLHSVWYQDILDKAGPVRNSRPSKTQGWRCSRIMQDAAHHAFRGPRKDGWTPFLSNGDQGLHGARLNALHQGRIS